MKQSVPYYQGQRLLHSWLLLALQVDLLALLVSLPLAQRDETQQAQADCPQPAWEMEEQQAFVAVMVCQLEEQRRRRQAPLPSSVAWLCARSAK